MGAEHLSVNSRLRVMRGASGDAAGNTLRIVNLTRQTQLGTHVQIAGRSQYRRKGLLGRDCLESGEGLWIVPCEAVHTFCMRFPLDLIYLDRGHRVVKIRSGVPAWRISACLRAHSVLELAAGVIRDTRTEPGDQLSLEAAD
jgi:uncharacterized membrane protein (UPF0127 family)